MKCIQDEIPFKLPEGWEWVRLDSCCSKEIKRGKMPKYIDNSNVLVFAQKCNTKYDGINMNLALYLDESTLKKYSDDEYMQDMDTVINSTGTGTLGRVGIYRKDDNIRGLPVVPDSHVTVIRTYKAINSLYVYYVLKAFQHKLEKLGEGSTNQKELKPITLKSIIIPLPPYKVQNRIVEHISTIYLLIDNIEQDKAYLQDTIQLTKSKILDLAIRGNLVPQDPDDEPASVLLNRIRAEKEELIKQGKIKRDNKESVIFRGDDNSYYETIGGSTTNIDDEIPFDLPDRWMWARLQTICEPITDGTHKTPIYSESGYIFLSSKNVTSGSIDWDNVMYIPESLHKELYSRLQPRKNDILLAKNGTTGIAAIVDKDYIFDIYVTLALIRLVGYIVLPQYLVYMLGSSYIQEYFHSSLKGIGVPNLHLEHIRTTLIPVAPANEQKRIADKVSQLFSLLDSITENIN